jgi:hypothetical protein
MIIPCDDVPGGDGDAGEAGPTVKRVEARAAAAVPHLQRAVVRRGEDARPIGRVRARHDRARVSLEPAQLRACVAVPFPERVVPRRGEDAAAVERVRARRNHVRVPLEAALAARGHVVLMVGDEGTTRDAAADPAEVDGKLRGERAWRELVKRPARSAHLDGHATTPRDESFLHPMKVSFIHPSVRRAIDCILGGSFSHGSRWHRACLQG